MTSATPKDGEIVLAWRPGRMFPILARMTAGRIAFSRDGRVFGGLIDPSDAPLERWVSLSDARAAAGWKAALERIINGGPWTRDECVVIAKAALEAP